MNNLGAQPAERLDRYVFRQLPSLSRAACAKLINQGKVLVNAQPVTKPGQRLKAGDQVSIDYGENERPLPTIDLPVIYEDQDCVVINKPAGVLTHSKGTFNPEATVETWLRQRVPGLAGERAGIVHRLDRLTSGVMICAKSSAAMKKLQRQFAQRKTKKIYLAVIDGHLDNKEALIDMPIERHPKRPQTFRVGTGGRAAKTLYRVLKEGDQRSLVQLSPTTGRTHQLRVHLKHLGHPILGDTLYGGSLANRLFLHASSLEITLPSGERRTFSAPTPKEFTEVVL